MRNLFSTLSNNDVPWTDEPDEEDLLLLLYSIEPRMLSEVHVQKLITIVLDLIRSRLSILLDPRLHYEARFNAGMGAKRHLSDLYHLMMSSHGAQNVKSAIYSSTVRTIFNEFKINEGSDLSKFICNSE